MSTRRGVFISHIAAESAVALVLKNALQAAFGDDFPVFVSTDKASIAPGEQWYEAIVRALLSVQAVIVLLSKESFRKPWINFESGVGVGSGISVVPLVLSRFANSQVSFPIAGMQIYAVDQIGIVVSHVARATSLKPIAINNDAYVEEVRIAEASLEYRSFKVIPVFKPPRSLCFDIENTGNVDLELLMFEVCLAISAVDSNWISGFNPGIDREVRWLDEGQCFWVSCYSPRGAFGGLTPLLRPILTESMGRTRIKLEIPLAQTVTMGELKDVWISTHLHAVDYATGSERFNLTKVLFPDR